MVASLDGSKRPFRFELTGLGPRKVGSMTHGKEALHFRGQEVAAWTSDKAWRSHEHERSPGARIEIISKGSNTKEQRGVYPTLGKDGFGAPRRFSLLMSWPIIVLARCNDLLFTSVISGALDGEVRPLVVKRGEAGPGCVRLMSL